MSTAVIPEVDQGTASGAGSAPDAMAEAVALVGALGRRAREAAYELAIATRAQKDLALHAMAAALEAHLQSILDANRIDVDAARADGTPETRIDRLRLDRDRVRAMAAGLRDVAGLPDPIGEVVRGSRLANGLDLRQIRVPLGVIGIVYEARPNVTSDAAGLCLKSGNAVLLRGSSSALSSNARIVEVLRDAIASTGLRADGVQLVGGAGREPVRALQRARGLVDTLIPRGSAELIRSVVESSTVPVIETGVGNCHVFVDRDADLSAAVAIVVNAKASRPSVCNAAESLLVHSEVAQDFLPRVLTALDEVGVTVHADERTAAIAGAAGHFVLPAIAEDWDVEYLSLDLAVAVVDSLDDAVAHIRAHGSGHTEAVLTRSEETARRFVAEVDAAAVMVNASTRFTDGAEFGFGAEVGISTQKLHARGPMGLSELTSTKYVVTGTGHVRA